jgi:hypothetical protein
MKTYGELVTEVTARGYDFMASSRIEDFVARSYQTLSARYNWPWLEESKETTAPFEIKDLRHVLSVTDTTQERPLWGTTRQWILERYPKLEETGNAVWWFLDNLTLRLFPLSEDKVAVRYVKKSPALEKASDEPLWPEEWRYLIVDQAVAYCLKDNDEYSVARELEADVKNGLNEMIADQLQRDWQSARSIVRTAPYGYGYL